MDEENTKKLNHPFSFDLGPELSIAQLHFNTAIVKVGKDIKGSLEAARVSPEEMTDDEFLDLLNEHSEPLPSESLEEMKALLEGKLSDTQWLKNFPSALRDDGIIISDEAFDKAANHIQKLFKELVANGHFNTSEREVRLTEAAKKLCDKFGINHSPPIIISSSDMGPFAADEMPVALAKETKLDTGSTRQFIHIHPFYALLFTDKELTALIAHEIIHYGRNHNTSREETIENIKKKNLDEEITETQIRKLMQRTEEQADREGSSLFGDPETMKSVLAKVQAVNELYRISTLSAVRGKAEKLNIDFDRIATALSNNNGIEILSLVYALEEIAEKEHPWYSTLKKRLDPIIEKRNYFPPLERRFQIVDEGATRDPARLKPSQKIKDAIPGGKQIEPGISQEI